MSDKVFEEDDLISQDDIDSLLDISSGDDDDGELSQDDIDSLLNSPVPDADDSDAGEEDAGELSQDDIDDMMSGVAQGDDDSEDDGDDEFISLEDIQSAISGDDQGDDAPESEAEPEAEPEPEPEVLEAESTPEDVAEQKAEDGIGGAAPGTQVTGPKEDPFDEPIDEDQAADVVDCMMSQDAMDALIEAGLPALDPLQEDIAAFEADAGDGGDDNLSLEADQAPETDSDGTDEISPETDGDSLDSATQGNDDDDDDVTQEDIDALLQQSDENDALLGEDEDILISQDDINTLLMAADQEDDDVFGDIVEESDASDLEAQLDDSESDSDQVALDGIESAEIPGRDESALGEAPKSGKIKALFRSKVVLAAASVLLFMGISVPLSYFLFFSSEPAPLPERQASSLTDIDLIRDGQVGGYADMPVLPLSRRPGSIVLTDFIILASDHSQTMTYVHADVSIDYLDQRAYDEINGNLAFYRDLIYRAIQVRLVSEKNNEVTEADLLWGVEASLEKVLPPKYIDKISFKLFKAT